MNVKVDMKQVRAKLKRMAAAMAPDRADFPVRKTAFQSLGTLKKDTPKKWTGQTRRSWGASSPQKMTWLVLNSSKVMRFLEFGTKAHGPVKAKALFIPLDRKTAMAGPDGVMSADPEQRKRYNFIFRKWVRGIKAQRIVRNHLPVARQTLKANIIEYLKEAIRT